MTLLTENERAEIAMIDLAYTIINRVKEQQKKRSARDTACQRVLSAMEKLDSKYTGAIDESFKDEFLAAADRIENIIVEFLKGDEEDAAEKE